VKIARFNIETNQIRGKGYLNNDNIIFFVAQFKRPEKVMKSKEIVYPTANKNNDKMYPVALLILNFELFELSVF